MQKLRLNSNIKRKSNGQKKTFTLDFPHIYPWAHIQKIKTYARGYSSLGPESFRLSASSPCLRRVLQRNVMPARRSIFPGLGTILMWWGGLPWGVIVFVSLSDLLIVNHIPSRCASRIAFTIRTFWSLSWRKWHSIRTTRSQPSKHLPKSSPAALASI